MYIPITYNINLTLTSAYAAFVLFCFFFFFSVVSRLWSTSSLPYYTPVTDTSPLSTNYQLPTLPLFESFACSFENQFCVYLWKGNSGFFGYWAFWEFDVGVMIFESWDLGFHYCHGGQLSSGWTWSERSVTNCRLGWLQLRWASVAYLVDGIFMRLSNQSLGFVILARLVPHCIW